MPETYLKPCQASKMRLSAKIVNSRSLFSRKTPSQMFRRVVNNKNHLQENHCNIALAFQKCYQKYFSQQQFQRFFGSLLLSNIIISVVYFNEELYLRLTHPATFLSFRHYQNTKSATIKIHNYYQMALLNCNIFLLIKKAFAHFKMNSNVDYTNLQKTAITCFQNLTIISRKPPCWNALSGRFSHAKKAPLISGHLQGNTSNGVRFLLKLHA